MYYVSYYRYDTAYAWRFTNLRSGQSAASVRSLMGGEALMPVEPAHCRTSREIRSRG